MPHSGGERMERRKNGHDQRVKTVQNRVQKLLIRVLSRNLLTRIKKLNYRSRGLRSEKKLLD